MYEFERPQLSRLLKIGYAADPAIDILLDKSKIAQLKIRQLELVVRDLEAQVELANMEIDLLKEEYKAR